MLRGIDMSNFKMSLVVLCVASATLAYPGSAGAQYFEGSGVLGLTQPPEVCLGFFPDSGQFPLGLLGDWGDFQLGDHIYAAGVLLACGGFCSDEGLCFDPDNSVFVAWPFVPAVSEWGLIALGLLVLVAGTIVLGRRKRYWLSGIAFRAFFPLALCASSFAQDPLVAQKVERMLQSQHHPNNMLVRFKAAAPQAARDALHAAAGAVKVKTYRFVDGLTLVKVPGGDLSTALTSYLSDANVLYAEPDYVGEVGVVPNDTFFGNMWGMQNTGQVVHGYPGTAGADIRAVDAWDIWTGDPNFRIAAGLVSEFESTNEPCGTDDRVPSRDPRACWQYSAPP